MDSAQIQVVNSNMNLSFNNQHSKGSVDVSYTNKN